MVVLIEDPQLKEKTTTSSLALIPCYNEEATIGEVVLKAKHYVDQVLVVDDDSSDKTTMIALDVGAVVLSHLMNKGKGAAIKTGFSYALAQGFDNVVTIDGDGQHDPGEIPIVLSELSRNGHDIMIGTRFGHSTEMPFWRKIGKRVLDYATGIGAGGLSPIVRMGSARLTKKPLRRWCHCSLAKRLVWKANNSSKATSRVFGWATRGCPVNTMG